MNAPRRPPPRGDAARRARSRQRVTIAIVGVVALAAVIGIAALTVGGSDDDPAPSVDEVAGEVVVEGDSFSPAPEDPTQDADIGNPAPVIRGEDFDGQPVTIGEPGSPQLLMFLASWCPVCEEELPEVVEWLGNDRLPEDVELIAIATGLDDNRPNWPPQDWLDAEGYDGPVLVDDADGTVAQAYGLPATPYWVALDSDGRAISRLSGLLGADQLDGLASLVTGR